MRIERRSNPTRSFKSVLDSSDIMQKIKEKTDIKRCYRCGEWCNDEFQDNHCRECNGDKTRVVWSSLFTRLKDEGKIFNKI